MRFFAEREVPPKESWPETTLENGKDIGQGLKRTPEGWTILDRRRFSPINLIAGDSLSLTYTKTWDYQGTVAYREVTKLATYEAEKNETIDTAIICRLDDGTLKTLGLRTALVGILGEHA